VKDSNDPNNSHLFGVNENSQTSFKNSFKNEHFAPNSNSPAFALFYMIKLHLPLIFKHRSQSKRILMTDSNLECMVQTWMTVIQERSTETVCKNLRTPGPQDIVQFFVL
jgi:hypothetical protein